jgi:type I restriction enzyme S subunit
LDELMAAQARKVEALKEHKKGLMQQLFPREGESQPRLRFPEFRGKEEWDLTTIGSLGSFYYGKSAPKWSLAEDATTPCVRYGELYTKFGPVITETFSRTNIDPTTLRFSKGGEILVPRVGEKPEDFGKSCSYLPLRDIAIGEMISVFETDQDPLFYTYYFRNLYKQFASVVEGQNVKNLYYVELEPLAIYRPALAEQQKVAECLSSLDELMAAQARKVEALKEHKKGLMQQLFPREGETQPRLRFPEFRDAGEWEEKAFAELCDIKHGYAFESEFFSNEGDYVLLTPGNFYEEGGYRDRGEKQKYFTGEIPSDYVLTEGAMLIAMTEQASGLLGSPIIVPESDRFLHNQRLGLVTIKPGVAWLNEFFFHVLNSQGVRKAIHDTASGAKVRHTSPTKVGDVVVSVPPLPEQHRIATCLSSLDDLITAETQKLDALKTHKRGLMQQLFPPPHGVEE